MAGLTKLARAARSTLENFMGLQEDETLLVVADENRREIGMALYEAGKKIAAEAMYVEMQPREDDNEEPPEPIGDMMQKVDCVVCPTTKSIYKTYARREASKQGIRVGTIFNISKEAFERCMIADHTKIKAFSEVLIEKLKNVYTIRVIAEAGTDITMPVKRRRIHINTGLLRTIGESGNLPTGEIKMAPLETKSNGKIVIDGSMQGLGMLENPITFTIKKGYADRISGKSEAKDLSKSLSTIGRDARALGVIGIGLNDKAELQGEIEEDRIVLGTVHIGFGKNSKFGGKIVVDSYVEGVIKNPTLYFDDELIIEDGKVVIDF